MYLIFHYICLKIIGWLAGRGTPPPRLAVAIQFIQTSRQLNQCFDHWHPVNVLCPPLVPSSDLISMCKLPNCWPGYGTPRRHPVFFSLRLVLRPSPRKASSPLRIAFSSDSKLLGLSCEFFLFLKPHMWHWRGCVCMFAHACSAPVSFVSAPSNCLLHCLLGKQFESGLRCDRRVTLYAPHSLPLLLRLLWTETFTTAMKHVKAEKYAKCLTVLYLV